MLHSHWPQIRGCLLRPPELSMEKLTPGLGDDGADTAFGDPILMMGANPRNREVLMIILDFLEEIQFSENAIVGAIARNGNVT